MHPDCLTDDAFGSLRCDCGIQLRHAFRTIAAEGRGVLVMSIRHRLERLDRPQVIGDPSGEPTATFAAA